MSGGLWMRLDHSCHGEYQLVWLEFLELRNVFTHALYMTLHVFYKGGETLKH